MKFKRKSILSLALAGVLLVPASTQFYGFSSESYVQRGQRFASAVALTGIAALGGILWWYLAKKKDIPINQELNGNLNDSAAQVKVRTRDKIQYLFSHGLFNTGEKQVHKYLKTYTIGDKTHNNKQYIIGGPVNFFDYPDAAMTCIINRKRANIAQDNDVAHLKLEVEKTIQNNQEEKLVLVSVSRGASTALNFMALHDNPNVKALIVESPFDSMATVVDYIRKQLHLEKILSHDSGQCILETIFRQYKKDGMCPIDLVSDIRKELPILIVCSKEDLQVPWHSSEKLYQKLKKSGHDNVHLLVVPKGMHAHIITGKSGDVYQAGAHAFCAKYGLPHDTALALEGEKYLN